MLTLPSWQQAAACVGQARVMDPEPGDAEGIAAARRICAICPVRAECMEWALSLPPLEDPGGILAGLTEEQRGKATEVKTCTSCGETRPLDAFGWVRRQGRAWRRSQCRDCWSLKAREYRRKKARQASLLGT